MNPNMKSSVTVTRPVISQPESQSQSVQTCETTTYVDTDLPLPFYYYPNVGLFIWLFICLIVIGALITFIQFIIFGTVGVIFLRKGKKFKCPVCGEVTTIKGKEPEYCKVCGASFKPPKCP